MPTILSRRMPVSPGDDEAAFATVTEMFVMVQRSNHATAFAGWVVATSAMGLLIEAGAVRSASHSPTGALLFAALVPVLALAAYVVALLVRANGVTAAAQEDFYRFIAVTPPDTPGFSAPAWLRIQKLTAAARHREMLSQRALIWAYALGVAFLAWSGAAAAMASGH